MDKIKADTLTAFSIGALFAVPLCLQYIWGVTSTTMTATLPLLALWILSRKWGEFPGVEVEHESKKRVCLYDGRGRRVSRNTPH